jgi:hypothetical protein
LAASAHSRNRLSESSTDSVMVRKRLAMAVWKEAH